MSEESKEIFILGGPNGAGKTTAARVLPPEFIDKNEFLNADEIARSISPANPESAAMVAGRELLLRMRELIRNDRSFALETTCAGRVYVPVLNACKRNGWRISLFYFWLSSPEASIARVARRVREGGHDIPVEDIYRGFKTGLSNMRQWWKENPDCRERVRFSASDSRCGAVVQNGGTDPVKLTSRQILDKVDRALAEVDRRLKSGGIDGSGRFYTDEELAAGAATGGSLGRKTQSKSEGKAEEPAA